MSETAQTLAPQVPPLLEADPNSINLLIEQRLGSIFNKKPPFTDDDMSVITSYYRAQRGNFLIKEQEKANKEPVKRRTKPPGSVAEAIAKTVSTDFI